jgi:diguanylate cyclase (GGDEF)-like protein
MIPLTVALVRIEGYPAFVEAHGLATGEAALKDLGRLLRSTLRAADPVGRVGTDEFALCLVHTAVSEARAVAERVADVVAKHSFPRRKRLRVECGLAAFPEGGDELGEILQTARRRLVAGAAGQPVRSAASLAQDRARPSIPTRPSIPAEASIPAEEWTSGDPTAADGGAAPSAGAGGAEGAGP